MKKKIITISVVLSCMTTITFAQRKITIENNVPNSIVMVSLDDADEEIIRIINETQLNHVHDPQAPRFILTDRKGSFALGIGGYVRTVAEYDLGGISDNVDFLPALIPNNVAIRNRFQLDATTTNLFVKLVGNNNLIGDFIIHTEGNFRGDGRTFKLRNAYMAFSGVTIGYTYGAFMDAAASPSTIDFQGPNGSTFYRTTQLSYTYEGIDRMQLGASVEMPNVDTSNGEQFNVTRQRMPDIAAFAQYGWNENSHVRLGGIIRSMTYSNDVDNDVRSITGFGIQASTTFSLGSKLQLFGQFTYGKGIGNYLNDLSALQVDLVPNPNNEKRLQALPMMGWYAALQYNFTPSLFASATYSTSRLYSKNGYKETASADYKYGQYIAANLFWKATPNMQFGAEYLFGQRTDFDTSNHSANRINLMAKYSF